MSDPRLAKFRIKKFGKEIEPQEVLLDSLAQKKEKEIGVSEKRLETPLPPRMLKTFLVFFLLMVFVLLGKTFQIQVLEGRAYTKLSEENEFIIRAVQAERGVIYDNNLKQLVFNKPSFDFVCDGKTINENLDHQTLVLLETKIDQYPNCQIQNNTARKYSDGSVFAHLMGYYRKTGERTGLEGQYDEVLAAKPGELQIQRDVHGNPISKEVISMPETGQGLVLWLDSGLQEKITNSLAISIKNAGATGGAAVALDPNTGGVLSLVSIPNFDNNLFSQEMSQEQWQALNNHPQKPLFNRVIAGEYPSGSTVKPLVAAAALQEQIISPLKAIYDPGQIEVPHRYDPEIIYTFRDWKVHGWVDMRQAIAESCNVYFYTIGGGYEDQEGLGPSRIKEYLNLFGWGALTQIDIAGERPGLIPDPAWKKEVIGEDWWDGDTYYLSIGQQYLLATPLQVATAFAAIANNGTLYQPQVVSKILDGDKKVIQEIAPTVIRENFIKADNLQIVKEGMRDGVTYGSSALLNSLPVKAAAKTGTAQTAKEEVYHNWLTVFAPYENPKIVLTVVIENVAGMQTAALPVAREVLEWYFSTSGMLDRTTE